MLVEHILPIFGLILIGWVAAATGLLSHKVGTGLSDYVFALAVPALIISSLTRPGVEGDITISYWLAYFGSCALTWLVCSFWSLRRGTARRAAILEGYAASSANTIFLGVPIILQVYGEAGMMPLFMLLALHLPLMVGAATLLIESDAAGGRLALLSKLARVMGRNPIMLALIVGLLARLVGWQPAGGVKTLLDALGSTASTCALLALGIGMQRYRIRGNVASATRISLLKLVVHPGLVWLLAFHVFDMPPVYAGVATLFAAMPAGINAYMLAARYQEAEASISSAVVLSTLAAMGSTVVWLMILGGM